MNKRSEILSMLIRAKIRPVFILLVLTFIAASCKVMQFGKIPGNKGR